jgi:outer membrane lipoprotein carrier protein
MRLSWRLITFCLGAALVLPGIARAQADPALIRRVDDHYNHLTSLRAHYTEHYAGMGLNRTESGTLTLKKPGRMRWSYDSPPGKVTRAPAQQLDDLRSPLRFLLGHTQLAKELNQLTTTPDPVPTGLNFRITGVPKGMAQRVRLLTLVVTPAGEIQSMKIEEMDGALTEFTFTGIEEDIPVKPSDFTFTPPPGITVVDAQPPI